jgi:thiol-disulfide isomerase/thioredoxin
MQKLLILVTLSLLSIFSLTATAASKEAFTQERFESLQAAGKIILVDVYATWCPTCQQQQQALSQFQAENPDSEFYVLVVDFDKDKEWVSEFRAPRQSTLLLYVGDKQHWFSVAETRYDVIAHELNKAIVAGQVK